MNEFANIKNLLTEWLHQLKFPMPIILWIVVKFIY